MDEVVAGQTCRGPRRRASCSAERRCVRQLTQPLCHDVQRRPARTMHPGAHRTRDEVVSGLHQRVAIAGALSTDVVAWVESITSRPRAARTRPGPPSRRVISSMVPGARRPRIGAARTRVAPSFPRRHLCTSTTSRSCSSPSTLVARSAGPSTRSTDTDTASVRHTTWTFTSCPVNSPITRYRLFCGRAPVEEHT